MPFLPLFNAAQVMHTHLQYLDFKNGQGLRYLTEFDQGIIPINNYELIYTYQGLTGDGKYYVAAVLPVNQRVIEIVGFECDDPLAEFGGKIYNAEDQSFAPLVLPPPLPSPIEQKILDRLDAITARLDQLERKSNG